MAFKKKKKEEEASEVEVKVSDYEELKSALEDSQNTVEALKNALKVNESKMAVLSENLISKQEETRAYESIRENSETVFSKSGFRGDFLGNVAIINTDHIIEVTKLIISRQSIECNIITKAKEYKMIAPISKADEFKKQYEELLNLI